MYNKLNAWGRQREVPAAPTQTFRQWYLENRGRSEEMSARDDILDRVRAQPAGGASPLPAMPPLAAAPGRLLDRFKAGVVRMGGKVADAPADGDLAALVARLFPDAKVVCSATRRSRGKSAPRSRAVARDLHDVDVGVVRAIFGVAETGSVWITDAQFKVNALGFLVAASRRAARSGAHRRQLPRRIPRARAVRRGYGVFMTGPRPRRTSRAC